MDYYCKLAKDIIEGTYKPDPGEGYDIAMSRSFEVPDDIFKDPELMALAEKDVQRLKKEIGSPDASTPDVLRGAIQLAILRGCNLKDVSFRD